MSPADLLPPHGGLTATDLAVTPDVIVVAVAVTTPTADCPACGGSSGRVHSRYRRTLADLPVNGRRFVLRVTARRFVCRRPGCGRSVFCERLPGFAAPHARATARLAGLHRVLGLVAGGEPGSRLAAEMAAPTSGDTILRRAKAATGEPAPIYRHVGVDDFALRKGHVYGTILVDLDRGRVIDLFEGRDGAAVEAWLKAHPGVEVVTRDRWAGYANAAAAGAPQAVQVADRWHLLRNLLDALKGVADRHHADVRAAARAVPNEAGPTVSSGNESNPAAATEPGRAAPATAGPTRSDHRRARRLELYESARALYGDGVSVREIARRLGLNRGTARRYALADEFPERAGRPERRTTDPFRARLRQRFDEGCGNAARLFEELKSQGYRGSYYAVRRQVARWRSGAGTPAGSSPVSKRPAVPGKPSARRVAWLLLCDDTDLGADERAFRGRLLERSAELRSAAELAREFRRLVRERASGAWEGWRDRARAASSAGEVRAFAEGLTADEAAVRAALRYGWSNGPVEGQVGRLKPIKRSGYGRAGFELLRARVKQKA